MTKRRKLDLRIIPATPEPPSGHRSTFSVGDVSMDTSPPEKSTSASLLDDSGSNEVMRKSSIAGFTILEVLIASLVFTVVLMLCIQAITRIGQLYFKGVTSAQIQDLTRKLSEEFSGQIQFGSGIPYPDSISGNDPAVPLIFCVGDNRYRAIMNRQLGDVGVATVLQRIAYSGACDPTDTGFAGATELAIKNMRILKLSVIRSPTDPYIWTLNIRLALGDSDIFDYPVAGSTDTPAVYGAAICKSGISGSQFCATSELSSTLLRRVRVE